MPIKSAGGGASVLDGLTDVSITSAALDDLLVYDGAVWKNTKTVNLQDSTVTTYNIASPTKKFRFDAGLLSVGTTRIFSVPNSTADCELLARLGPSGGQRIGTGALPGSGTNNDLYITGRLYLGSTATPFVTGRVVWLSENISGGGATRELLKLNANITVAGTSTATYNGLGVTVTGGNLITLGTSSFIAINGGMSINLTNVNANISSFIGILGTGTLSNWSGTAVEIIGVEGSVALAATCAGTATLVNGVFATTSLPNNAAFVATDVMGILLNMGNLGAGTIGQLTGVGIRPGVTTTFSGTATDAKIINCNNIFSGIGITGFIGRWAALHLSVNLGIGNPVGIGAAWFLDHQLDNVPSQHLSSIYFCSGVVDAIPTAHVHHGPSPGAGFDAPEKFDPGTLIGTPEPGALEYDGLDWFLTQNDGDRNRIAPRLLSRTVGIDGTAVAATTIYTVPTGRTLVVTDVMVRTTAVTALTVNPTFNVKGAVAGDIVASAVGAFTAAGQARKCAIKDPQTLAPSTQAVALDITGGATATTLTLEVDLIGYLI